MRNKILIVAAGFLSLAGMGVAQSEMSAGASSGKDRKLITAPPTPSTEQQQFEQNVKDVHFDFDRAELRAEDRSTLAGDADWLKAHPDVLITLEGDADERGDIVYNVVLSGARATVTKDALVDLGVSADRIVFATGWGKLYPVCSQSDENCWSQNRRTHFATWPPVQESAQVASR